jgi:glycosyltransferase involved in cell wall biosynthesis
VIASARAEVGGDAVGLPATALTIVLISSAANALILFRSEFIRALADRGFRVIALAPDYDPSTRDRIEGFGAEAVDMSMDRTGQSPLRDLLDLVRLVSLLRRLSPDAVFGYFIKPVIYGSLAAWLAGVRRRYGMVAGLGYVFTPDGRRESWKRKAVRTAVKRLYKFSLSRCERAFFLNADDLHQFLSHDLVREEKTVLIPGEGLDLDHFTPAPPVTAPLRFLLIARLLREKGIIEYVEAARIVRERHPKVEFHLLGGWDSNPGGLDLGLVEGWAREGVIAWTPELKDVRPAIAASSVFVLPSYREGKPRSTQEAMAMARPIITTDVPGCRDTVVDGVNGFMVPVRDVRALADAMIRFVDEPELIPEMGAQSRRIAEREFDVGNVNKMIVAAMEIDRWAQPHGTTAPPSSPLHHQPAAEVDQEQRVGPKDHDTLRRRVHEGGY